MPTYQYTCTNPSCGHNFERVQSFTDDAISVCPECAGRVRKVYGSVGVVFKGSGFYRNDSRDSKSSSVQGNSDSSSSSSSTSGGTSSSDSSSSGSSGAKSDSGSTAKSSGSETKATSSAST